MGQYEKETSIMMMTDPPKKFKYLSQTALCSTWLGVLGSEKKKENDGGGGRRERETNLNKPSKNPYGPNTRSYPSFAHFLSHPLLQKKKVGKGRLSKTIHYGLISTNRRSNIAELWISPNSHSFPSLLTNKSLEKGRQGDGQLGCVR